MAQRKKPPLKKLRTIAELAAMVDRHTGTVCKWLKRADWPFGKKPPWPRSDVPKILRWVADTLEKETTGGTGVGGGNGTSDDAKALRLEKLREEIRKIRANADQAETALRRERGELIAAAEVESGWAAIGAQIRNAFANLPSQIVPLALNHGMPHQAAAAFQDQLAQAVTTILRKLSSDAPQDDDDGPAVDAPGTVPA